jgi:hypothetical protein
MERKASVKLHLVIRGHYRVVLHGKEVGNVERIEDNRWRIRLDSDPDNRKRRAFSTLKMARQHLLGLSMGR